MEANTVVLSLDAYHKLQEMEREHKIAFTVITPYNYGSYINGVYVQQMEQYQFSGKDEAIQRIVKSNELLVKQNNELSQEIQSLRNPLPAMPTPEDLLFERLKKASRRQRREFLKTGRL